MPGFDVNEKLNEMFAQAASRLPDHLKPATNNERMCSAVSTGQADPNWNGFVCSRPFGHTGDHVAHGRLAQICYRW